jgi:hypothetical protein
MLVTGKLHGSRILLAFPSEYIKKQVAYKNSPMKKCSVSFCQPVEEQDIIELYFIYQESNIYYFVHISL